MQLLQLIFSHTKLLPFGRTLQINQQISNKHLNISNARIDLYILINNKLTYKNK